MECKNCKAHLDNTQNFCPKCGAKVIRNRLTFRNLWEDFSERFLNYDNTFLHTFLHLFTRPERVITGYIRGVRKRYMDPLSYLGIALTLSGVQLFVTRRVADQIDWDIYEQGLSTELTTKVTSIAFDYSSFMFLVFIPVFALAGWLAFNKNHYLFSESIILFIYALAQWTIAFFLPTVTLLFLAPEFYMQISLPMFLVMIGYTLYCLQCIHRYPWQKLLWRTVIYIILSFIGYLGIIVLFYAALFATGTVSLRDFVPPE